MVIEMFDTSKVAKLVVALVLLTSPQAEAHPDGAPSESCARDIPGHGSLRNGIGYRIEVSSTSVQPGGLLTVTVTGGTWQGLKLQALVEGSVSPPVGTFSGIPSGLKTITCSNDSDTITHSSQDNKEATTFKWQAPSSVNGQMQVSIKGPVLLGFSTYDKVSSPVITIAEIPNNPQNPDTPQNPQSPVTPQNPATNQNTTVNQTPKEDDDNGKENSNEVDDKGTGKNGQISVNSGSSSWKIILFICGTLIALL